MLANEMQVRLQVPIGISHRLSLLSAAARKVVSIPQSRIAGRIFDLTHAAWALPRPAQLLPYFTPFLVLPAKLGKKIEPAISPTPAPNNYQYPSRPPCLDCAVP